ncbi:(2Fe-2S)-binding protein [Spiractinospora alimapuensis]|uniref:(2Fe-2S)-binding protein n=1 Tax=Spiractinospora alimapuensis TaxID=2820884 RepID=UPI001F1AE670|nr:(2Fe-2S)-binding protein [Spiractinospora alimapuensis]QVQ53330.1 (2Fe-2S)-binding protein [Spiractinospora alimapuensis]
MPSHVITLTVNDRSVELLAAPGTTLLTALRDTLGLTAAKRGCAQGSCGSCTVLINDNPAVACLVPVETVESDTVRTLEGVGGQGELDDVQAAMLEGFAAQCGFCTPGMIMAAEALLDANPDPTEEDVAVAISGNVCRCTGYASIVRAVLDAARRRRDRGRAVEPASVGTEGDRK